MDKKIKKNLLDLKYSKYLQYYNTMMILLFTYFIAIIIAFVTRQLIFSNIDHLFLICVVSIFPLILMVNFMITCKKNLKLIPKQISNL